MCHVQYFLYTTIYMSNDSTVDCLDIPQNNLSETTNDRKSPTH